LSGFVIAYSYGARLAESAMSFGQFVKLRLIRLYPLLFFWNATAYREGNPWSQRRRAARRAPGQEQADH
jgi:hypothetical protein